MCDECWECDVSSNETECGSCTMKEDEDPWDWSCCGINIIYDDAMDVETDERNRQGETKTNKEEKNRNTARKTPPKGALLNCKENSSSGLCIDDEGNIQPTKPVKDTYDEPKTYETSMKPSLQQLRENDRYEEEADQWFSKETGGEPATPPPTPPPEESIIQYTPSFTINVTYPSSLVQMNQSTSGAIAPDQLSHAPDDILWINWTGTEWDGQPFDPTGKSNQEICAFLGPSGVGVYALRGLREKFYDVNPFADNTNPTIAEIDSWNIEVIKHIRNLFGVVTPVENDARLYLETRWSSERKNTTDWDVSYPGTLDSATGPCVGGTAPHCGWTFFPDESDRLSYINESPYNGDMIEYPELLNYNNKYGQTEGIAGIQSYLPWSIKLATVFGRFACTEGLGGHAGPFLGRQKFGVHWDQDPTNPSVTNYRGQWT